MNKTKAEIEIEMFGESIDIMKDSKPEYIDNVMYAMMILSDAQEVLLINPKIANQFINKAKWFLAEENEAKRNKGE